MGIEVDDRTRRLGGAKPSTIVSEGFKFCSIVKKKKKEKILKFRPVVHNLVLHALVLPVVSKAT